MKAILITFDQAHYDKIITDLSKMNIRGFTSWKDVQGRGTTDGIPHYGSHAWPSMNNAILTVVEDEKVKPMLDYLRALDDDSQNLGLRAFVMNVEDMV